VIRGARATIWALRNPEWGDCLLEEALRLQIVQFEAQTGIPVRYDIEGEACQRLSRARELVLLKATQEALQNIHKHARATQAIVCLSWAIEQDHVRVSIRDNGRGIGEEDARPPADSPDSGVGLMIMRERVESLGGRVSLDSEAGRGTTVHIVLPMENGAGELGHA
jgi:two-component system sensor histidine kinase DegS